MIKNHRIRRAIALFLLVQFSFQIFFPSVSYALTSGPSQPEFSSFEPVSSSNMVDDFTGDFSYTIPLMEVPGPHGGSYPISLSYHSGTTPEEEASWVGYGWTINSGAINRNVRGIPDDFKNDQISFFNKTKPNYTITAGFGLNVTPEIFSFDKQFFSLGINSTFRYNNYRGFTTLAGIGIALGRGVFNLGYSVSEGDKSYSLNINPAALLNYAGKKGEKEGSESASSEKSNNSAAKQYFTKRASRALNYLNYGTGSTYGIFTYNQAVLPTQVTAYSGNSYNVSAAINIDPAVVPVGIGGNVVGSYTSQENEDSTPPGFGYMYSASATTNSIMDYHVDNENPYDKQDLFLGVPFNDADNFIVSGEGVGGGFRLYNTSIGHFGQRHVTSNLTFFNTAVEFAVGSNFGAGGDIGVGTYKMEANDWQGDISEFAAPDASVDEPVFARFNNDLGGSVGEAISDNPQRFGIGGSDKLPQAPSQFSFNLTGTERSGRSSYVGYHTNKEMTDYAYKAYSKRSDVNVMARRQANPDRIGEIAVSNEDGLRYIYALPVYSKEENNMSYGLRRVPVSKFENNRIVYDWDEADMKVGQYRAGEYAHTYLLTDILTSDYLDVSSTADGPTPDDFGGYVRFGYWKTYGNGSEKANNWYRWRIPYNGAGYERNQLSDPGDDIATVVSGQKEIYYLKTIETKTHVAVFSFSDRTDGLAALNDIAAKNKGATSADALKKLDRIDLYSLAEVSNPTRVNGNIVVPGSVKPIKTVHLKYSSTGKLMPNAPNGTAGKLTLERVYFEYQGLVQVKTSPYIFKYNYPRSNDPVQAERVSYPDYPQLQDFSASVRGKTYWGSTDPENPPYSAFSVDAWGNYQPFGANSADSMRTWLNQRLRPNDHFDPAPWHLKRIKLPTGGEIHVQYEQDDYHYVQNENAHIMVRLQETGSPVSKFYLDLRDMGLNVSDPQFSAKATLVRDAIREQYVGDGKKKMYFKFLYKLKNSGPDASTTSCNAEYLTGYAKVVDTQIEGQQLAIQFEGSNLPIAKCREYVFSNVTGRVNTTNNCDRTAEPIPANGDAKAMVMAFLSAGAAMFGNNESDYCGDINEPLSYLRIPAVFSKKGGGIRVKRLLMYDNSIDGSVLYGNEYNYTTEDGSGRIISSGVATNEPGSIREENILVNHIPKKDQSWQNRLIVGKDKEQYEGPPGESIYPGPTVGYSKIVVTNIHTGKTNPGFSVKEFYTAKDYPVVWKSTEIDHRSKPSIKFRLLVNKFINQQWATQGYSYVLNSMHGQLKRTASYGGNYAAITDLHNTNPVTEQVFEFFAPGETLPVMSKLYGTISYKPIGREMDVTLAQKSVSEASFDGNMEMDFTVGLAGIIPIPFVSGMASLTENEAFLKTHVSTKVVRYPSVVKKITTYQDGIYHTEENAAFDEYTGKPVAIKSYDEFKGAYLAHQVPASWEYPNFTQTARTENKVIAEASPQFELSLTAAGGYGARYKLGFSGNEACKRLAELVTGDLLEFNNGNLFHVEAINYSADYALIVRAKPYSTGLVTGSAVSNFRILKTGRNNQLNAKAGNIVFHNADKDAISPASYSIPDAQRYDATGSFVSQLNAQFNLTPRPATFTLAGPFTNMNMSAYEEYAPCCAADWSNATVSDLYFQMVEENGAVTLNLIEFKIDCLNTACGQQLVTVKNQ